MSTQPTTASERHEPRVMLALITLSVDLPVPQTIDLYGNGILVMSFDHLADALAWATHLGGHPETYVYNGRRFVDEGVITWKGWKVQIGTSAGPDELARACGVVRRGAAGWDIGP